MERAHALGSPVRGSNAPNGGERRRSAIPATGKTRLLREGGPRSAPSLGGRRDHDASQVERTRHEAYVIEAGGAAVGIVVRVRHSFRFYASDHAFAGLEDGIYCSPEHAERAAEAVRQTRGPTNNRPRRQVG